MAVLLGLGAFLPAASAASARVLTRTATAQVSGPSGSLGTAVARCPRGTAAISGGYLTDFVFRQDGSGTAMLPYTSRRQGRRAWKVSAYTFGSGDPLTLTARVNCAAGLGRLFTRKRHATATGVGGNPMLRSVMAHCPRHSFALAGGFHYSVNGRATNPPDTPPVAMAFGSRAVARSWGVTVARQADGISQVTAFAYCSKRRPMARHHSRLVRRRSGPPASSSVSSPPCPDRSLPVSGGFTARFPLFGGGQFGLTIGSGLETDGRWRMDGFPLSSQSPLNSIVYCLSDSQFSGSAG
ncbi:MAG: hypothetical protein U0R52_01650 [Solirubrobacterales bacterium]